MALLHFYVDPASEAEAAIRAQAQQWQAGESAVEAVADAGWQRVGHLRV